MHARHWLITVGYLCIIFLNSKWIQYVLFWGGCWLLRDHSRQHTVRWEEKIKIKMRFVTRCRPFYPWRREKEKNTFCGSQQQNLFFPLAHRVVHQLWWMTHNARRIILVLRAEELTRSHYFFCSQVISEALTRPPTLLSPHIIFSFNSIVIFQKRNLFLILALPWFISR